MASSPRYIYYADYCQHDHEDPGINLQPSSLPSVFTKWDYGLGFHVRGVTFVHTDPIFVLVFGNIEKIVGEKDEK